MIGILACSKTKLDRPAPALELYCSDLFRAVHAYLARHGCDRFIVLSGLHGAVPGDRVLAPYDHYLGTDTTAARAAWAERAGAELRDLVPAGEPVLAIVGQLYAPALATIAHTRRFAGLSIGRLKGALRADLERAA